MEIETESLRKVINLNGKSFNCIESSRHSKLDKSYENGKSKDLSCHYVYKDRLDTGSFNDETNERGRYEDKNLEQRIRARNDDVFHKSDFNKTSNYDVYEYNKSKYFIEVSKANVYIYKIHQPDYWFFGHWHHTTHLKLGNTHFQCIGELDYIDFDLENLEFAV